jgi:hypothetical protein
VSVSRFLLPGTKKILGPESSVPGRALVAESDDPDALRTRVQLQSGSPAGASFAMPPHTLNETANSNPPTAAATAPAYPAPSNPPDPSYPPDYSRRPMRVDAIYAMLRYPYLVIIPILLLGAVGYVLAGKKQVTYKAEAQVLIGQPSPGTAGELPGVVQAEQSLAGIYAREIDFNQVLIPLARQFNTTPADIASRLSATPDPQSPLVRIFATASSPSAAVVLANGASTKFAATVNSLSETGTSANQAFGRYKRAVAAYQSALGKQQQLQQQLSNSGSTSSVASNPALQQAAAASQIAQLHVTTLADQYQSLLAAQQNAPTLSVFESAAGASSNHKANLEIYVFGGLVAGLLIGAALATLMANRMTWRTAPAA